MLPGFRFLFAAIVLSLSILVFGLGAAALLRAAHEEFASIPSRRAPPEHVFAQRNETPTLALLRVEPSVAEKTPDTVAAVVAPEAVTPSEQAKDTASDAPEKMAALKPDETAPTATVTPEGPAAETTPTTTVIPAEASVEETKLAAIAETPAPVNEAQSAAPARAAEAASPEAPRLEAPRLEAPGLQVPGLQVPGLQVPGLEANAAATTIATLGGPAVTIDQPAPAKTTGPKPHRSEAKKRARAERKKEHRTARRARQAVTLQQSADPFGQPMATVRSR